MVAKGRENKRSGRWLARKREPRENDVEGAAARAVQARVVRGGGGCKKNGTARRVTL